MQDAPADEVLRNDPRYLHLYEPPSEAALKAPDQRDASLELERALAALQDRWTSDEDRNLILMTILQRLGRRSPRAWHAFSMARRRLLGLPFGQLKFLPFFCSLVRLELAMLQYRTP